MNRRLLLVASVSCWAAIVVPASAQEFVQIPGTLTQVGAGRQEVWGINSAHKVYRFNAPNSKFVQVAGTLTQVAVGGGSLMQSDAVWGVSASGEVFQYNFATKKLAQVPGALTQITVGDGDTDNCHPYEVWGLNAGQVYRFNHCSSLFENVAFPGTMTRISTGGSDVWGLSSSADIFQYDFQTDQWVQIGGTLQQIAVGVNDVWGLDGSGKAYRFDHSAGFVLADGSSVFTQIAVGGNGAWAINSSTKIIARFDPNVGTAIAVPGNLAQIAVGCGAGVWGVNSAGSIFSFVRPIP